MHLYMYMYVVHRVLLGSVKDDHRSLLEDLRAASSKRTPLNKVLDARKLTEQYRYIRNAHYEKVYEV